jgi:hypothetical protein
VKDFKYLKASLEDKSKCNISIDLYVKSPLFNLNNLLIDKEFFVLILEDYLKIKINENIFQLFKGECLYIPQYINFFSVISENSSIFCLIKLKPNNAYSFFKWFLNEKITKYEEFYNSIEIKENFNELYLSQSSKETFELINKKFIEVLEEENILNEYYNYIVKNQEGLNIYNFPDIYSSKKIDNLINITFFRKEHQSVVFEYEDNLIIIYFWKRKLCFPKEYKNLLELIFSKNVISSEEILMSIKLEEYLIINLLNSLIRIGVLEYKVNN